MSSVHDPLTFASAGFRLDSGPAFSSKDTFYAAGNFRHDGATQIAFSRVPGQADQSQSFHDEGFNATARWTHNHSDTSQSSIQIFDNHYQRSDLGIEDHSNAIDFDFQNQTAVGSRNDVVWGSNYRLCHKLRQNNG